MTKAEKFIQDYTNHCSNELEGGGYHEWLTPEQARGAVKIARDEMLKEFEKQGEQKPAWSEKDDIGLCDALWAIQQAKTIAKDENDMGNLWYAERWLKSVKERIGE
jgi:hypothetical protein